MSVIARMKVDQIIETTYGKNEENKFTQVVLRAVVTSDPNNPNYSFSKATPNAELKMTISNPDALSQLTIGKTFDLIFTECSVQ